MGSVELANSKLPLIAGNLEQGANARWHQIKLRKHINRIQEEGVRIRAISPVICGYDAMQSTSYRVEGRHLGWPDRSELWRKEEMLDDVAAIMHMVNFLIKQKALSPR
ncbi:unnamed protein product [Cercopithifilaria johnstoni]|uniref:Uncharacterized protein n=1 Tax=Cercopithifilaria johnstoni TaxID=2874296 RepID=A0A8J2MS71_9BILA|nr:unnamed protein product [Cercopithifilaria johnstoni]